MAGIIHTEELALFTVPPTNSGVEKIQWVQYRPVSQLSDQGAIEFAISGNSVQYVDLRKTKLHVKFKVENTSGNADASDEVTVINYFLHTMWSSVDVFLQQQPISTGTGSHYAIKAYLETLLNYGEDAKESQLTKALFYQDNGDMDSCSTLGRNMGLNQRFIFTQGQSIVDVEGSLHADVFQQPRYILNGVDIGLKLWPSKDSFRLINNHNDKSYKVTLVDACLKVCKVTVAPPVVLAHNEALSIAPAKYPYQKTSVKVFTLPAGQHSASLDDVFQGACPSKLTVGFVAASAYNGNFKLNPLNFKHYSLNFMAFYVNGESVPTQPITCNFEQNQYIEAYQSLFTVTGKDEEDSGNEIDRLQYKNGNTLFGFLVDPTAASDLAYWPVVKHGHTRLDIKFSKALPESVNVILYATFPGMFQVDASRNVIQ